MSCRAGETWSAPVFLELAKGSWGFQAGAEEVDVVMLVMNESGVQKLLKNKVQPWGRMRRLRQGRVDGRGRSPQIRHSRPRSSRTRAPRTVRRGSTCQVASSGRTRMRTPACTDPGASPSTILASRSVLGPDRGDAVHAGAGRQPCGRSRRREGRRAEGPPPATAARRRPAATDLRARLSASVEQNADLTRL